MRRILASVTLVSLLPLLAGCPSAPRQSAVTASDGVASFRESIGTSQDMLMSLHSLSLEPGAVVRLPDRAKWTNSAIVEHSGEDKSYLRVETYGMHMTSGEMGKIRASVDNLTSMIGRQLASRLEAARSENARDVKDKDVSIAVKQRDATLSEQNQLKNEVKQLETQVNQKQSERNTLESKIQAASEKIRFAIANQPADESLKAFTAKTAAEAQRELGDLQANAKSVDASLATGTKELDAKRSQLNIAGERLKAQEAMVAQLQSTAKDATTAATQTKAATASGDDELRKTQRELAAALEKPNVVVFRWNADQDQNQSGAFSGIFSSSVTGKGSVNRSRNDTAGGYAVMNGFRRIRLVIGEDFRTSTANDAVTALGAMAESTGLRPSKGTIVTSVIQTRELMYFTTEELSDELQASLEAKLKANNLTPEQKAEIEAKLAADYRSLRSIQNSGYFSSPDIQKVPIDWQRLRTNPVAMLPDPMDDASVTGTRAKGWITVHAVTASIQDILAQRTVPSKSTK